MFLRRNGSKSTSHKVFEKKVKSDIIDFLLNGHGAKE